MRNTLRFRLSGSRTLFHVNLASLKASFHEKHHEFIWKILNQNLENWYVDHGISFCRIEWKKKCILETVQTKRKWVWFKYKIKTNPIELANDKWKGNNLCVHMLCMDRTNYKINQQCTREHTKRMFRECLITWSSKFRQYFLHVKHVGTIGLRYWRNIFYSRIASRYIQIMESKYLLILIFLSSVIIN